MKNPNSTYPYTLGYFACRDQANALNPFEVGSYDWRVWNSGFQTAKAEE